MILNVQAKFWERSSVGWIKNYRGRLAPNCSISFKASPLYPQARKGSANERRRHVAFIRSLRSVSFYLRIRRWHSLWNRNESGRCDPTQRGPLRPKERSLHMELGGIEMRLISKCCGASAKSQKVTRSLDDGLWNGECSACKKQAVFNAPRLQRLSSVERS